MSKRTRIRACPAAGREITAAECGSGRHTTYSCPESCPFNPFSAANYGDFGRIEYAAEQKLLDWTMAKVPNPAQFLLGLEQVRGDGPNTRYYHYLAWRGTFQTGPDGETCIGKWAKAGFPSVTADERVFLRGRSQMRPAILEVHRLLDHQRMEAVDLLDADKRPILVVDRGFALQAVRFGVYAVYLVPLPNYCRICGVCTIIPDLEPLATEAVIREIIGHLGGGADPAGFRSFLAQHFERFEQSLRAVALARHEAMLDQLDAHFGKAVYRLNLPYNECRARLDASPEVADDALPDSERAEGFLEGRVFFARPGDQEVELVGEHATLGRMLLGRDRWRLQAMGAERLSLLRQRFEALMADAVRFTSQRKQDLAASLRDQQAAHDPALVPPALLRDAPRLAFAVSRVPIPDEPAAEERMLADFRQQHEREFLDRPVPALSGKTPRQAASDPALRPELVRLLKSRIRSDDERNLEAGGNEDHNWMLRELGLNEILFDPPPPRPTLGRGSRQRLGG